MRSQVWQAFSLLYRYPAEQLGLRQLWDMKVVRSTTLLSGGSPLGLATGGLLLAFVPSTIVIAFSAFACILVSLSGLASPTFRGLSLPSAEVALRQE